MFFSAFFSHRCFDEKHRVGQCLDDDGFELNAFLIGHKHLRLSQYAYRLQIRSTGSSTASALILAPLDQIPFTSPAAAPAASLQNPIQTDEKLSPTDHHRIA